MAVSEPEVQSRLRTVLYNERGPHLRRHGATHAPRIGSKVIFRHSLVPNEQAHARIPLLGKPALTSDELGVLFPNLAITWLTPACTRCDDRIRVDVRDDSG